MYCARQEQQTKSNTNSQKWRNWQTHRLQVPVVAIPCGFKSHLLHTTNSAKQDSYCLAFALFGFFVSQLSMRNLLFV